MFPAARHQRRDTLVFCNMSLGRFEEHVVEDGELLEVVMWPAGLNLFFTTAGQGAPRFPGAGAGKSNLMMTRKIIQ